MTKPNNPGRSSNKSSVLQKGKPSPQEINALVALLSGGRYSEAVTIAQGMTARFPMHGFGWMMLGMAFSQMGRNADALAPMKMAAELSPGDVVAFNSLSNILRELGRLIEAEACCLQALQIKPDYAGAHYNLGNIFKQMGRLSDAESSFRRALALNQNFVEAHVNLGVILRDMGQLKEAEASYRQALQIKPNFAMVHFNLGNTLRDLGKLGDAVSSYQQALQIKPDYAEAHTNLGVVLAKQGKLVEAVASHRKAISLNPDYADAYSNLAGVLRSQDKLDEALACYQKQASLAPEDKLAQHHIASLTGNNTERAPVQYVESVFDAYAEKFDTHLQHVLKYEIPEKLMALITQNVTPPSVKWNVLDLGCGTGLVGQAFAPFVRQLIGVDLSENMLEKARSRNLYQRLERMDLLTMMRGEKHSSYDVIIAADVFIYIGKLDEIICEAKRLLCPGGIFAFSVESLEQLSSEESSQGALREYQLEKSGRYAHTSSYITGLAAANRFETQKMVATQIRFENDKPVNGHIVMWKS